MDLNRRLDDSVAQRAAVAVELETVQEQLLEREDRIAGLTEVLHRMRSAEHAAEAELVEVKAPQKLHKRSRTAAGDPSAPGAAGGARRRPKSCALGRLATARAGEAKALPSLRFCGASRCRSGQGASEQMASTNRHTPNPLKARSVRELAIFKVMGKGRRRGLILLKGSLAFSWCCCANSSRRRDAAARTGTCWYSWQPYQE